MVESRGFKETLKRILEKLTSIDTSVADVSTETTLLTVKTDTGTIAGDTTSINAKMDLLATEDNRNKDDSGRQSFNTVFGDKIVAPRISDLHEQFHYNINTKTLTSTTNGTGTITQANIYGSNNQRG